MALKGALEFYRDNRRMRGNLGAGGGRKGCIRKAVEEYGEAF